MSPAEPVTGLILSGGGARAAYQVVLDTFAEDGFSAYREQALVALKHLPAG